MQPVIVEHGKTKHQNNFGFKQRANGIPFLTGHFWKQAIKHDSLANSKRFTHQLADILVSEAFLEKTFDRTPSPLLGIRHISAVTRAHLTETTLPICAPPQAFLLQDPLLQVIREFLLKQTYKLRCVTPRQLSQQQPSGLSTQRYQDRKK